MSADKEGFLVGHFSFLYKVKVRDIFLSRVLEALPGEGTAAEGGRVVLIREDGGGSHHPHSDAHHQHALRAEGSTKSVHK